MTTAVPSTATCPASLTESCHVAAARGKSCSILSSRLCAPLIIAIRFCGGDKRYCGDGCQSAFGNCAIPNSTTLGNPACNWSDQGTSPRCDGQCGSDNNNARCDASFGPDALAEFGVFNYGPCCSSSGYDCFLFSLFCELLVGTSC